MSGDASRARMTGPLVKMVASTTWLSAMLGFFSVQISTSQRDPSARYLPSLPDLLLGVGADRLGENQIPAFDREIHAGPAP